MINRMEKRQRELNLIHNNMLLRTKNVSFVWGGSFDENQIKEKRSAGD